MEQNLNVVSAEEMFGTASKLISQGDLAPLSGIASLGSMYQVATSIIALLFIFILVRYYELYRNLIFSLFQSNRNREYMHTFTTDIHNIEIFTNIAGISLISLFVMRLSVIAELKPLFANIGDISSWSLGGLVFLATFLLVIWERGVLVVVGFLSEHRNACEAIWHMKLLHFSTTIILLTPLLILALLTEGTITKIALYASITVCFISLILFVKETFLLFRAQRFSIFHWILYLCALEFFPISLLLSPILRGGF